MKNVKKMVGTALKQSRKEKKLTQAEMCEFYERTRSEVSLIESGKINITLTDAEKYLNIFKLTLKIDKT